MATLDWTESRRVSKSTAPQLSLRRSKPCSPRSSTYLVGSSEERWRYKSSITTPHSREKAAEQKRHDACQAFPQAFPRQRGQEFPRRDQDFTRPRGQGSPRLGGQAF